MTDPPPESRAVFLSYSREDAEPARRIADALRVFGMEVWFDQNELRGGGSWDAKIKKQIRECALFLPIISAHTQSRMEGYFRREWKLGVEILPESRDAVEGPNHSAWRAKILAWCGDKDQAIAEFSRPLHVPYGTNVRGDLHDPGWLPLQDDPRFKALLADPSNNEPIK
jgi:hypothetical protein